MRSVAPSNEMSASVLAKKCQGDTEFAQSLEKDPKRTLEQLINAKITQEYKIRTVRNTPDRVYVPLPCYSITGGSDDIQLQDGDLAQIAGGEIFVTIFCTIGAAIGIAAGGATLAGGATVAGVGVGVGVSAALAVGVGVGAAAASGKI